MKHSILRPLRGLLATGVLIPLLLGSTHALATDTNAATPQWQINWCEHLIQKDSRLARILAHYLRCDEIVQTNTAPVAIASAPQVSSDSSYITLDGAASSDEDGDTLSYQWTQIAGTDAIAVDNLTSATPTLYLPTGLAGEGLVFELVVSDGELTHSTEVVVDIPYCEDTAGTVFTECVSSSWAGISAWEMLNDGTYENYHYTSGHNNYQASWQVTHSGDEAYGNVIDVQYKEGHDAYSMVRIYNQYGAGSTTDMSAYQYGHIEFDLRMLDWGNQQPSSLDVIIECVYPCTSAAYQVETGDIGEWHNIVMPVDFFINTGLDIHNVEMGFQISPHWGEQAGVHFQVDNVRWVEGEAPVDTSLGNPPPEAVDNYELSYLIYSSGAAPGYDMVFDYEPTGNGFYIRPYWQQNEFAVGVMLSKPEAFNFTDGELTVDVFIPVEAVGSDGAIELEMEDAYGNFAKVQLQALSSITESGWVTLTLSPINNATIGAPSHFDISNITGVRLLITRGSAGEGSFGEFIINNLHLAAGIDFGNGGNGGGNPNDGLTFLPFDNVGWVVNNWSGDSPLEMHQHGNNLSVQLSTINADDRFALINYLPQTINLTNGTCVGEVYVPNEIFNSLQYMEVFVFDEDYNYASIHFADIYTLNVDAATNLARVEINADTLGNYNIQLDRIHAVGIQLYFVNPQTGITETIEFSNLGVRYDPSLPVGNSNNGNNDVDFSEWAVGAYTGEPGASFYASGDTFYVTPEWQAANDQLAIGPDFYNPIDVSHGQLSLEVFIPEAAANSPTTITFYAYDVFGNRAIGHSMPLNIYGGAIWETVFIAPFSADAFASMDPAFDSSQVASFDIVIAANGSALGEAGEFAFRNFMYMAGDPPPGNENLTQDMFVFATQGTASPSWYFVGESLAVIPGWQTTEDIITAQTYLPTTANLLYGGASFELFAPQEYAESNLSARLVFTDINSQTAAAQWVPISALSGNWQTFAVTNISEHSFTEISDGFDATTIVQINVEFYANGSLQPQADIEIANGYLINN